MENEIMTISQEWISAFINALIEIFQSDLGKVFFGLAFAFAIVNILKLLVSR